jgi:hypothetical protein
MFFYTYHLKRNQEKLKDFSETDHIFSIVDCMGVNYAKKN